MPKDQNYEMLRISFFVHTIHHRDTYKSINVPKYGNKKFVNPLPELILNRTSGMQM